MTYHRLSERDWRAVPLSEDEAGQVLATLPPAALSTWARLNRRDERRAAYERAGGQCEVCGVSLRHPDASAADDGRPPMVLAHLQPLSTMDAATLSEYTHEPLAFVRASCAADNVADRVDDALPRRPSTAYSASSRRPVAAPEPDDDGVTVAVPRSALGVAVAVALGARHGLDVARAQRHSYRGVPSSPSGAPFAVTAADPAAAAERAAQAALATMRRRARTVAP